MAKKKQRNDYSIGDGSIVAIITESLSKKGEIRGRSKKQTKVLRGACVHHVINRKGKVKARIWNDGKSVCTCTLCKFKFGTKLFDDKSLDAEVNAIQRLNNQAKFLATAAGADEETVRFFSEMGSKLMFYGKSYRKLRSVVEKRDSISKKKTKNKTGSQNFGSWG